MFFKQIRRNAASNRKDNGLFFGSLIIAIIAFYTLLSIGEQDVMRFLKSVESNAVEKLMLLIPLVYAVSLFFVFFLIYFAYHYQLNNRKKEFGLYLMMGMKRSRLFAMLMGETLLNSIISVLIGLPIALLLTEGISLATAKLIGLGIIGHKLSFSLPAILWTIAGFILVQLFSMLFLSIKFSRQEPALLLQTDASDTQRPVSGKQGMFYCTLGFVLLVTAYATGVLFMRSYQFFVIILVFAAGISGTFLLYRGMGAFIGRKIRKTIPDRSGLFPFTGRQIQENVLCQHKALAIASLLLLLALSCISYGIGISAGSRSSSTRSTDFSIRGETDKITEVLESEESRSLIDSFYPMFLDDAKEEGHQYSVDELCQAILAQPASSLTEEMASRFASYPVENIISVSSYNALLKSMGKQPLDLGEHKTAIYTSFTESEFVGILNNALKKNISIQIDGQIYELLPDVYYDNVVADRQITLYSAFIVPDDLYQSLAADSEIPFCCNVVLKESVIDDVGLMQAIENMQQVLDKTGLEYESYLAGIGRNLFYTVAGSYITIYLGVLFMIIANTVIGLKYMMQLQTTKHRYLTLIMLGAEVKDLCRSSRKQIMLFFSMVLGVAICNSIFAIWSMFTSFTSLPANASYLNIALLAAAAFILFLVIELIYVMIVERNCRREILLLQFTTGI